eukprot:511156-Pelagomonas_calceolata.AAC.3
MERSYQQSAWLPGMLSCERRAPHKHADAKGTELSLALFAGAALEITEVKSFGFLSATSVLSGEITDLNDNTFEVRPCAAGNSMVHHLVVSGTNYCERHPFEVAGSFEERHTLDGIKV